MSLNLDSVIQQIGALATDLRLHSRHRMQQIQQAMDTLVNTDGQTINQRRAAGRFAWPIPELPANLASSFSAIEPPTDYQALSTDGSHIDVDRHLAARCALINISKVMLQYGSEPEARLGSTPVLYADNSLSIPIQGEARDRPLDTPLVGVKRSVDEVVALAELAEETEALPAGSKHKYAPTLALIDGSLVLWGPAHQQYPDQVRHALIEGGLIPALDRLKYIADKRPLALAAYVSLPRNTGVADALRLAVCPFPVANCSTNCGHLSDNNRPCDTVGGLLDRDIFGTLLRPGERSALFANTSPIVEQYYGAHHIYFFYLNTGEEIARVEVPSWVANNEHMTSLTHSLILDQCRKGMGYPVAIMEAHEQAVIDGNDRELFRQMIEEALEDNHLAVYTSQKARSKHIRWL